MALPNGLVGLLCFALMAAAAAATQFRFGGDKGWGVPDGTVEPYNTWSGRMRFQIGDQLHEFTLYRHKYNRMNEVFVYPKETDSVLLVDQAAYNACNTTTYVTKFEGGSTVFTLDRSGPFFFISGNVASCTADQKLIVVVLAADHTPPPSSMPLVPSPASPPSPPSTVPPSGAPAPSPMSPPSMAPPSGTPMPSPMSPPSGAPMPTPESAPSPTASAPGDAPVASPGSSPPSSSPGTPGGAPQPGSGAAPLKTGLISTLAAGIAYAMLAI